MSDELAFTLFVLGVLLFCGGLFYLARRLSRRVKGINASNITVSSITPAGVALSSIQVALMVGGVVVYKLFPDSAIGRSLGSPQGIAVAFLVLVVAAGIAGGVLRRRGVVLFTKGHQMPPNKSLERTRGR
jgi:hypothetical protein